MKKEKQKTFFTLLFLLVLNITTNIQAQNIVQIDSAKKSFYALYNQDKAFVQTCFFIADNYMDIEQYDSAQVWLNKIHLRLPIKSISLSNYFLTTRQAEVYYYNNLQQLGLQESMRGLDMAKALNDSLLLADSYNFLGLFFMNMDSTKNSLPYFKSGIKYTRQPPYPVAYVSLTKPHHLYGNLAEAFSKLGQFDSALLYNKISLKLASQIKWGRGIAVGYTSMGDIFFSLLQNDSAIFHFNKGIAAAKESKDIDVELLCYAGLAKCFDKNKNSTYKAALVMGLDILQKYPMLNRFFALQFLTTASHLFKVNGESSLLIKTLELKSEIETANIKGSNSQIQTILNAGLANEKRVLNLEVDDAKQKQKLANSRLAIALIAFGFLGIGFLVYRYYQNQKLAISKIRHTISQDLHDDIGASLSSLQIYGAVAEKTFKTNPEKAIEMLQKISMQSKTVMENMNDIVWSMNTNNANTTSLEAKVKNYSVELLSDNNINFNCSIDVSIEPMLKSITAKRNILLIIREAMNNIAKYSKATDASLQISIADKNVEIAIADNGVGFDIKNGKKGNGLWNMEQRAKELNGNFHIDTSHNNGTSIFLTIPLKSV
jgi:signal transduction histidine kinase